MDRGYLDFEHLFALNHAPAFFIVRAKSDTGLRRLYSMPVDKSSGLQCDQIVVLKGFYAQYIGIPCIDGQQNLDAQILSI